LNTFAIVGIGELVTMQGPAPRMGGAMEDLRIVRDGAILVEQGRIVYAGAESGIGGVRPEAAEVFDAGGRVVTPGLVDAHTHAVFASGRSNEFEMRVRGATYQQIAEAGGGIRSSVRQVREAGEEALLEQARRHARWMLASGTTTAEVKSGYGLDLENELKMLRVVRRLGEEGGLRAVPTFLGAHAVPEGRQREEYLDEVVEVMLPRVAGQGLARYCDAFVERGYFGPDDARRLFLKARQLGLGVRIHVDQLTDGGGAALAAELGADTADHLEQTGSEGIEHLRRAGVTPVLLPGSVYALGLRRYPDARAMIEAGLPVVLATDFNPGSSPTPSLPMAMSLACTQMRMTPGEAISACTVNAAHSLGLADRIGSIEAGKEADLVLWDLDDHREIPYFFGISAAAQVWRGGIRVV
jgi:imidazolonepropionase